MGKGAWVNDKDMFSGWKQTKSDVMEKETSAPDLRRVNTWQKDASYYTAIGQYPIPHIKQLVQAKIVVFASCLKSF